LNSIYTSRCEYLDNEAAQNGPLKKMQGAEHDRTVPKNQRRKKAVLLQGPNDRQILAEPAAQDRPALQSQATFPERDAAAYRANARCRANGAGLWSIHRKSPIQNADHQLERQRRRVVRERRRRRSIPAKVRDDDRGAGAASECARNRNRRPRFRPTEY